HGTAVTLPELRGRFPAALKGMALRDLLDVAAGLGFSGRPLKLDLSLLGKLSLPCILHWDMNHFVVLTKVRGPVVTVLDPAVGARRLSFAEVSAHFTGVAVEFTPNAAFRPVAPAPRVSLGAGATGRKAAFGVNSTATPVKCAETSAKLSRRAPTAGSSTVTTGPRTFVSTTKWFMSQCRMQG